MNTGLGQTGNDLDRAEPSYSEKKTVSLPRCPKQIPNIPNMKRHENHNKDIQIPSKHNRFIILHHFRATCFDSLESSSGPLMN